MNAVVVIGPTFIDMEPRTSRLY